MMREIKGSPSSHLPTSLSLPGSEANQFRTQFHTQPIHTARAWVFGLVVLVSTLLALLGGTNLAWAAKPVAVGTFDGPYAEDVRKEVADALNDAGELSVVKDKPADRVGINEPKGTYKDKAHELGVAGIVVGNVSDQNDEWSVLLAVYAATGELLQKFKMRAPTADKLNTKIRALLPERVAELLEDIDAPKATGKKAKPAAAVATRKQAQKPPPQEEPPPEEPAEEPVGEDPPLEEPPPEEDALAEEPAPEDEPEADDEADLGLSPLELHFAFGYSYRSFAYSGSTTPNLDISNGGWAWVSTLRAYPIALFSSGFMGNLGVELGLEQGFPHKLEAAFTDPNGDPLTLKFQAETLRIFFGPRLRIPFSGHELGIVTGYGKHEYLVYGDENLDVVDPTGEIDPCFLNSVEARDIPGGGSCVVPDVKYEYIRVGVDSRFNVGKLAFGVRGGYRFLLETGEISEDYWFGGVGGGAFDAGVMLGYALSDSLLAMVGFDYLDYRLEFDAAPAARASGTEGGPIATGASDVYLHGWAGLAVIVPGLD